MSPSADLKHSTFSRLQALAIPLVDTIDDVIARLLDENESLKSQAHTNGASAPAQGVRAFNPYAPPDLTHAKILGVTFNGKKLGRGQDNWNGLLYEAVSVARDRTASDKEFDEVLVVNHVLGDKHDEGYRPIAGTGVSVQGQDANGAWRAVSNIAKQLDIDVSVKFAWREKEGAAHPGETGQMTITAGT